MTPKHSKGVTKGDGTEVGILVTVDPAGPIGQGVAHSYYY